jgi:hypothetical protein
VTPTPPLTQFNLRRDFWDLMSNTSRAWMEITWRPEKQTVIEANGVRTLLREVERRCGGDGVAGTLDPQSVEIGVEVGAKMKSGKRPSPTPRIGRLRYQLKHLSRYGTRMPAGQAPLPWQLGLPNGRVVAGHGI